MRASPTACCWPRPTSGRRTRWPTSARARATSATWPSTSRSCRACSWPCAWRTASPSSTSWRRRRACRATGQWALFLRNHDELTLEMVTDEERDYMYRVYAADPQARINLGIRRRLAPLLGNNRRRIELMNGLLFSLPGTPVIYYGDEIGMGDNVYVGDRNGVRTPMQWSSDRNAGFSAANRQRLYLPVVTDPEYHYEAVNVETQQANPQSLLWWMKRIIALAQATSRLRPRQPRVPAPGQPPHPRLHPRARGRDHPRHRQPEPLRAVDGARARPLRGPRAGRAVRLGRVPAHRRRALHGQPGPALVPLVPARQRSGGGGPPQQHRPARAGLAR